MHDEVIPVATIRHAREGHSAALSTLCEYASGRLLSFIRLQVVDIHLAEDLTSESVIKMIRYLPSFTFASGEIREFHGWLYTIARSLIASYWRAPYARHHKAAMSLPSADEPEVSSVVSGPFASTDPTDTYVDRIVLLDLIGRLEPRLRDCLIWRYYGDQTLAETAAQMGETLSTVKKLHLKGLARLTEMLRA